MKNVSHLKIIMGVFVCAAVLMSCLTESETKYFLVTESIPENGGTVSPKSGNFKLGERIEIIAEPAEGYYFERWEGDIFGSENPRILSFYSDRHATAVFTTSQPISGSYRLEGIQINKTFCWAGCTTDETGAVLTSDTLNTSFTIEIKWVEQHKDTLQFFDLIHFENSPFCSGQSHVSDCAYARLTGNQLEFDRITPSGWYYGNGSIEDGELKLDTYFRYRGMGVDYHLTGERIQK